jgi:hypothetical protein
MKFQGFVGPTYSLKSVNVDSQRCVNLYPEAIESGAGKGGEVAYLKSTPGLKNILNVGNGPIRCTHIDPQGIVFVVSGDRLHKVVYDGVNWIGSPLGSSLFLTSTGTVVAASAKIGDETVTVFVDGVTCYAYVFTPGFPAGYFGKFADFGYPGVPGATHVAFIDGYFIFNEIDTNQFYVSDFNSLNIDPLSFASAEGDPDKIVGIIASNRDLWLFNERTTEIFVNTGNADFPFERVSGGFIEKGCSARFSIAKIEGSVFWLGRDESGQGIVYAARGLTPERISTHAVEAAISSYADLTTASAYTYQMNGHAFYVLNFAEATWVYDLSTRMWHERAYTNLGRLERHRAEKHVFIPAQGVHLLGDYSSNKVYLFDENYFYDGTAPITRMRVSPHISSELKRITCNSFQIDMEVGVGLDGITQGTNPQVMLDYSDDGGHSYSNEKWASAGAIGENKKRVIWRRLGQFRDRVFRIKITDPVKVSIIGAEIDIEAGAS